MPLVLRRLDDNEDWKACALRYARKYGLEEEVGDAFRRLLQAGENPREAAFHACYEWDVLEYIE
jgi:hypothetical protein